MTKQNTFAPGKIILSGEYAVLFGYAGIAIPSSLGIEVVFEKDSKYEDIEIMWENIDLREPWIVYSKNIVKLCNKMHGKLRPALKGGRLVIRSDLPPGKGMGSSTALVVAITRALFGEDTRTKALAIEDVLNPGHSGFDFATIWENVPILFRKGDTPKPIELPEGTLREAILIDTGVPGESTNELVAWIKTREKEIQGPLKIIGECTDRLVCDEPLDLIIRDHHKAQVAIGVVPPDAQELIAAIESTGGSAKVIGAGSRTGSAGMVLALGDQEQIRKIADQRNMPAMLP